MTLMRCPECGREVSSMAATCPHCGRPLRGGAFNAGAIAATGGEWGASSAAPYEYKSRATLFGLPVVHVVYGPAWLVGFRPACGIIAVGNIAFGVVAFGGVAVGLLAAGGLSLGLICLGGMALGLAFGLGGIATGYLALGGIAIGAYAIGGLGIGAHTLQNDPQLLRMLSSLFGRE